MFPERVRFTKFKVVFLECNIAYRIQVQNLTEFEALFSTVTITLKLKTNEKAKQIK